MTDLLITAGTVITVDADRRVIHDGAVAIEGDRIVEVGSAPDMVDRHEDARRIDEPHGIVIPGLVDAHGHAGHSLVRTLGGDDLGAWLEACERIYLHASGADFWRIDGALSALERLMSGTTLGLSMLGGAGDTIRSDDPRYALAHIEGVRAVGIRDVVVVGPGAPPFPKATTDISTGAEVESSFEDQMATLRAVVDAAHDGETTLVATTFPTLSVEEAERDGVAAAAAEVAAFADEHHLLVVQDGHRGSTVEAADSLGLLGERSVLSHAVDLDQSHIALVADRGAAIAHNPAAVYSQFGRCPVPELLESGVTVALGSDATAPDRPSDMFRHMFQATRYHRADRRDPSLLPPGRVLEMATVDGAAALGLGDQLGSIEAGRLADLVIIDGDVPHLTPLVHPVHQVVYYASGADVSTVVVGGQLVMQGREVAEVDVAHLLEEARTEHAAVVKRADLDGLRADRPGTWGEVRYVDGAGLDL